MSAERRIFFRFVFNKANKQKARVKTDFDWFFFCFLRARQNNNDDGLGTGTSVDTYLHNAISGDRYYSPSGARENIFICSVV